MTIAEAREKCKTVVAKVPRDVLIIGVLVLASSASFGLGYLAGLDAREGNMTEQLLAPAEATSAAGRYVASKNGTKYYLPSCTGVEKISEANKVWFASVAAAQAAGYTPAANCDGL